MEKAIIILCLLFLGSFTDAKAQFYGVKTNALYLGTGTINAGFETSVGKQWSVDISGYWNPVSTKKMSTRAWYVQPAIRYWQYEHFVGPFWSVHLAYGRYNVGNDRWHYKGWFSGLGFSYGYT